MPGNPTGHAHILEQGPPRRGHHDLLGELEVVGLEYFGVVHVAAAALLAEAVHVVPAEPPGYVLELADRALGAEAHVEVRAAFVDVLAWAVLALG